MATVEPIALEVQTDGIEKGRRALNSLAEVGPKVEKAMDGVAKASSDADKALDGFGAGAAKSLDDVSKSAKTASDELKKTGSSSQGLKNVSSDAKAAASGLDGLNSSTQRFRVTQDNMQQAYKSLNDAERKYIDGLAAETKMIGMGAADRAAYIAQTKGMGDAAQAFARQLTEKGEALKSEQASMQRVSSSANTANESYLNLAKGGIAAVAGSQIVQWGVSAAKAMFEASASAERLKTSLQFSTGNSAGEIDYLRKVTDGLGLEFDKTAAAYGRFAAASRGTALEGQKTRDVFESIAKASAVMGLTSEQSEGALRALEQMISKGVVSSEELKSQLGERLPGSFQTAARAMGVTTQELGKMLEKGEVIAYDFLPKFAAELNKSLGGAAEDASKRLDASVNRMENAWNRLKQRAGDSGVSKAIAGELDAVSRDMSAIGETIENASKKGDGALLALSKGAGVATMRTAFSTLSGAANLFNGTINLLTGNLFGLNTSVALLPEAFKTNAQQIQAMDARLKDADKQLANLQARSEKAGGGAYYTSEIARVQGLRNEYAEALKQKRALTGITDEKDKAGGGRGSLNPQTTTEYYALKAERDAYLEKDIRLTKVQQKERDIAKAREDNAKLVAKAGRDEAAVTQLQIGLATELANIETKYKDKSGGSATAGQSELASITARVKETQRYIDSLKEVGLQAEKTNEGDRLAAKLQEELAGKLTKTARASKERSLAQAQIYGDILREKEAIENLVKAREKEFAGSEDSIRKINEKADALQNEADTYGMSAEAIAATTLQRLEEKKVTLEQFGASKELIDQLNREIEARKGLAQAQDALKASKDEDRNTKAVAALRSNADEMSKLYEDEYRLTGLSSVQRQKIVAQRQIELKYAKETDKINKSSASDESKVAALAELEIAKQSESSAAINKVIQDDFAKTSESISNSLTDALMRGFENGESFADNFKKTLVNMFKTMILKPVIQAVVNPIAGVATNLVSSGLNTLGIGDGGGFGSLAGTASNAYSALSSPMLSNFGAGLAGNIQQIGGKLFTQGFETIGSGVVDFGNTVAQFSDAINLAGDVFGYGSAVYNLSEGKFGSAAGAAIGTYFGGPIGSAIGSTIGGFVDSLFGSKDDRYAVSTGIVRGEIHQNPIWEGGEGSFAKEAIQQEILGTYNAINSVLKNLGSTSQIERIWSGLETSQNDRGGSFIGGELSTGQRFGSEEWNRDMYTQTLTFEEAYAQFSEQSANAMLDALQKAVDVPGWAKAIAGSSSGLEGLNSALNQIALIDAGFKALGASMTSFAGLSSEVQTSLINASGGFDALSTNASTFYQGFYTEAERMEALSSQVQSALAGLDISIDPRLGDAAKAQFRSTVESVLESGNGTLAAQMLSLSGTFATAADYAQGLNGSIAELGTSMSDTMIKLLQDRKSIEAELLKAQGDESGYAAAMRDIATEGYTDAERAAYDYNEALKSQISDLNNASKAQSDYLDSVAKSLASFNDKIASIYSTSFDLENQVLTNQGRGSEAEARVRAKELAELLSGVTDEYQREQITKANEYNNVLKDQIAAYDTAMTAASEFVSKLTSSFSTYQSASSNAATYLGDSSGLQSQLDLMLSGIGSVEGVEARGEAIDQIISLEQALFNVEQKNREAAIDAAQKQSDSLRNQLSSVQAIVDASKNLKKYADSLMYSAASGLSDEDRLSALASQYSTTLSSARGGDVNAMSDLQSVSSDYLSLAQQLSGNQADYSVLSGRIAAELATTAAISEASAQSQATLLQSQIDAITESISVSSKQFEVSTVTKDLIAQQLKDSARNFDKQISQMQLMIENGSLNNYLISGLPGGLSAAIGSSLVPPITRIADAAFSAASMSAQSAELARQAAASAAAAANAATVLAASSIARAYEESPLPKFAVGTNYVPRDMKAIIHEGEMIVPKAFNPFANGGLQSNQSSMSNEALVGALNTIAEKVDNLMNPLNKTAEATMQYAEQFDSSSDGGNGMKVAIMEQIAPLEVTAI